MAALALIVGIVVFCAMGYRAMTAEQRRQRKALAAVRLWPIADVPHDTHVRVKGKAQALAETLHAPLTGRACFYYVITVSSYALDSNEQGQWSPVVSDRKGCVFGVADATGVAIVDPSIARVEVKQDYVDQRSDSLQYIESIIAVDEPIVVCGFALRETDPNAIAGEAYRGAPPTRVRFVSSAKYPIEISDDKKSVAAL